MSTQLSERSKLILALLDEFGNVPTNKIKKLVYPGQEVYLKKQTEYVLRTLHRLQGRGLITRDKTGSLWAITETGRNILYLRGDGK